MPDFTYVLVGGGMTGHAAAQGIRSVDPGGSILLVGEEPEGPYARPPLTKGLWTGQDEASIRLPAVPGVTVRTGARVVAIDRAARRVALEGRWRPVRYERLLLATGGTRGACPSPRTAWSTSGPLRTIGASARSRPAGTWRSSAAASSARRLAAALATSGYQVTLLFPEEGIGAALPAGARAAPDGDLHPAQGVEVRPGESLTGLEERGSEFGSSVSRARLRPTASWRGSASSRTTGSPPRPGSRWTTASSWTRRCARAIRTIFAAGDVARFMSPRSGSASGSSTRTTRTPWDARRAASMAGAPSPTATCRSSTRTSSTSDTRRSAILDPRLEIVADWKEPFREGVVYYLGGGRVRGVLAWGVFGKMDEARSLIAEPGRHDPRRSAGESPPSRVLKKAG